MAITIRAVGAAATGDSPASLTPAAPAGNAAGDVVLCVIIFQGGNVPTITPPAGWTLRLRIDSTTVYGMAVYSALGSATFGAYTISAAAGAMLAVTIGYQGVDTTTPMDATAVGQANASSATVTAPSITTVTANAMLVGFFGWYSGTGVAAPTWSGLFGSDRGAKSFVGSIVPDSVAVEMVDAIQAAAGASGSKTATASVASTNVGILVALRPAAAVSNPFTQRSDPNPRIAPFPIDGRTFIDPSEVWLFVGKDVQFAGAGQWKAYDWPNPRGYVPGISLRTWTDTLKMLLAGRDQLPFRQGNWPNPAPKAQDVNQRTHWWSPLATLLNVIVAQNPFAQLSWPNPLARFFDAGTRNWRQDQLNFNLSGQDRIYGAAGQVPSYDWPNPAPQKPNLQLRTFISSLVNVTLIALDSLPFRLSDWLNPWGKKQKVQDHTGAYTLPLIGQDVLPFSQPDWPNPKGYTGVTDLRSWLQSLVANTLGIIVSVPFALLDWPNPFRPRPKHQDHQGSYTLPLIGQDQLPFAQADWPVPKGQAPLTNLRTWLWDLVRSTLVGQDALPFHKDDWPNPTRGTPPSISLKSWLLNLLQNTLLPPIVAGTTTLVVVGGRLAIKVKGIIYEFLD